MKQKIFVDTNIAIDMLMKRVPFYRIAERLFEQRLGKTYELYVSTISFTTIHHLLLKRYGKRMAINLVRYFRKQIALLPVDDAMIDKALYSAFDDFEDAVQYQCAVASGMHLLITRNTKDYGEAKIAVMTANEFLRKMEMNTGSTNH